MQKFERKEEFLSIIGDEHYRDQSRIEKDECEGAGSRYINYP